MSAAQQIKERVSSYLSEAVPELRRLSDCLYQNPEVAFQEHKAAAALTEFLAGKGFEVERGVAGLPTAWRARTAGTGSPRIAFLSEYDALPAVGHGCGHHLIATAGVAAAVALRAAWPDHPGEILHLGTPAEETGGGKVIMVEAGLFDGVDAAMMFHPSSGQSMAHRHAVALQNLTVRFRGRPAHAGAAPWNGVNALDAMIQFFVNIGLLRQQLRPVARLHGVITNGGATPNVVPELTEAHFQVRAPENGYLREIREKVVRCAEAGALATGCSVEIEDGVFYANRLNNMVIARLFQANIEALGEEVVEPDPGLSVGSSDIGNVSLVCPTIHPYVKIAPPGVPGHTEGFRKAGGTDYAFEQMLKAAQAMAMTAADLLSDPVALEAARAEFTAAVKA